MSGLELTERRALLGVLLVFVLLVGTAGVVRLTEGDGASAAARQSAAEERTPGGRGSGTPGAGAQRQPLQIFGDGRFLVAYYGTAGTGSLGVLGETSPDEMHRRLMRAAKPFLRAGHPVQPVYELIVTVADGYAGKDGSYSHDIARADVQRYVDAARRNHALLLLDIQPGRSDFLAATKRWSWALKEPHVGLALDPEWRMQGRSVPGQVVGTVGAPEINRTSAWLDKLVRVKRLPQKLFVLHQFRTSMILNPQRIKPRSGLATVQHVDGFGTRGQKLATYRTVARPRQFAMGFKLFYDEDVNRMGPREVFRIRPKVRFISFQ